jgi:hypothetical protein
VAGKDQNNFDLYNFGNRTVSITNATTGGGRQEAGGRREGAGQHVLLER